MATGPSLTQQVVEYVRPFHEQGHVKVFGCNDTYRNVDYLDVLYACDPHWWKKNLAALKHPCQQKWLTLDLDFARKHHLKVVYGESKSGLCKEKNKIHFGGNSGFQLINLAWHFGCRRFILVGYNMDVPKGMRQHFFGKHPQGLNQENNYRSFVQTYQRITPEDRKKIVNCTEPTALTCFRKTKLEDELPMSLLNMEQITLPEPEPQYTFLGRPLLQ